MIRALLLVVLCGCGGGSTDEAENHGYGWGFDVQGSSGLRLRYAPTYDSLNPKSNIGPYEQDWASVQACMGVTAPAPFVILVAFASLTDQQGNLIAGKYLPGPPLFLIYGRDDRLDFRHEAVHYLLDVSTGDPDGAHRSTFFQGCV